MTYFLLLVLYRYFVKVVETWGVFIQGNLDMYLLTTFWLIDWDKNWDNFDLVRWFCCEVCRALVPRKVTDISKKVTIGVHDSTCALMLQAHEKRNGIKWSRMKELKKRCIQTLIFTGTLFMCLGHPIVGVYKCSFVWQKIGLYL